MKFLAALSVGLHPTLLWPAGRWNFRELEPFFRFHTSCL